MQLNLTNTGHIDNHPVTFFRVETWMTGRRVADFSTEGEAQVFAISNARETGCRYDHKVSRMTKVGR